MSVIVKEDDHYLVITKGACDELIKRCIESQDEILSITEPVSYTHLHFQSIKQ